MGFEKSSMVAMLLVMVMGFCGVCAAAVYKVGDSSGWTENGKVDYKAWSNSKTFHVGDTIVFEYDNRFSNVVRVNHRDYNACNNIHSYFSVNSGNDSFVIPKPGHFYFITGLPGHCQTGQRVDIRVPQSSTASAPAPAPAPRAMSATPPAHTPMAHHHTMSPLGTPTPSAMKHNGAFSIGGMWLAVVAALASFFFCFCC